MKIMKIKKIFVIFLALTAILLSSCGNVVRLKNDGTTGNLIDKTNDRYYIYCGSYLRAAEINKNVYAKGDRKEQLHEIPGIDPAEWLSENITTVGLPLLFREQSVEEPTLENFGTQKIHIMEAGEASFIVGLIDKEDDVQKIVNDYLYGNDLENTDAPVQYDYTFLFESDKYKGIYYNLQYLYDENNKSYLYDKWTKRLVSCSISLFNSGKDNAGSINEDAEDNEVEKE